MRVIPPLHIEPVARVMPSLRCTPRSELHSHPTLLNLVEEPRTSSDCEGRSGRHDYGVTEGRVQTPSPLQSEFSLAQSASATHSRVVLDADYPTCNGPHLGIRNGWLLQFDNAPTWRRVNMTFQKRINSCCDAVFPFDISTTRIWPCFFSSRCLCSRKVDG